MRIPAILRRKTYRNCCPRNSTFIDIKVPIAKSTHNTTLAIQVHVGAVAQAALLHGQLGLSLRRHLLLHCARVLLAVGLRRENRLEHFDTRLTYCLLPFAGKKRFVAWCVA